MDEGPSTDSPLPSAVAAGLVPSHTEAPELASASDRNLPLVHVAMATFNGRRWIAQQVRSILSQEGVRVRLVVSDDGSTDGTVRWLRDLAAADPRVTLLPRRAGEPGVGANFLYAFEALDLRPGEYAAFSDQDDLWRPGKLARQVALLQAAAIEAVSSNVVAFTANEGAPPTKRTVHKSDDQTQWDFLFEAPGPGSTFLLTEPAWRLVVDDIRSGGAESVWLHDWYVYALLRAADTGWFIDDQPQVAYRQHGHNALGQHRGAAAIKARFANLASGKYRDQFVLMAEAADRVGRQQGRDEEWLDQLAELTALLRDRSIGSRARMFARFPQIRRNRFEGFALATACLLGAW